MEKIKSQISMDMINVSIIIVNYNTCSMTNDCIKSIIDNTIDIKYEIIVVDNASTDGSKQCLRSRKDIKYIYSNQNLGFAKACNLGVRNSVGRNIFLLNSDTLLINNAIKILSDYLDDNENVAVVGGNLFRLDLSPTTSFQRIFPGIGDTLNKLSRNTINTFRFSHNQNFNYSNDNIEVAYIIGADLMIKRRIYEEINGLSEDYFMYFEETDLCYRITRDKYKIINIPNAKIIHLEGGSTEKKSQKDIIRRQNISNSSRITYMKRNHSCIYRLVDSLLFMIYQKFLKIKISCKKD